MPGDKDIIISEGVKKWFGDFQALKGVDLRVIDEAERVLIEKALERYQGNVSRAAEALGLSRSALYRRLNRHDIDAG